MTKHKIARYSGIVLRICVALVFLAAGSGKFQTDSFIATNFKSWGLGLAVMYIVGMAEILGALCLFFPKMVRYGCYMLITVMLGAMVIHFLNFETLGFPLLNVGLILLLSTILYLRKLTIKIKEQ